ncbi:MAG: hypothetical protein K9L66_02030 [Spirochaetaceae bacterium]|nr:hypothetical protein [Spirochaetaceae bacterium]MCF7948070.1 hypothetical protein [Spirochaetia bacterium]MCF7950431.1 hypothetical protein [Spirochaetaceae bacterium]
MDRNRSKMWLPEKLKLKTWYYRCIGTLELWVKKEEKGELVIGQRRCETGQEEVLKWIELSSEQVNASDKSIEWDWYAGGSNQEITVLPAMPNRPLVLKPQVRRHIQPGCKTQLLIFIPVWLLFYSGHEEEQNKLCELPSEILSSTWFGEMQNGELCYALNRGLLESRPAVALSPHSAACTLNIHNASNSLLDFQRMAVHVEYLSLFSDGHSLYTNEVYVKFNGVDKISQVKYSARGPKWGGELTKLKSPREHPTKNLLKKSFYFFKSLTEM